MTPTTAHSRKTWAIALFAGILLAMRIGIARSGIAASLDGQLRPALLSFALLLAPLWFFGFGLGEWLAQRLRSPWSRVAFPAPLGVPYLVFAFPAGTLRWPITVVVVLLPAILSAVVNSCSSSAKLVWQDAVVLGALAAVYLLRLLTPAWPYPKLSVLPKLYVADLALYLYIVVRKLDGVGYSLVPSRHTFLVGLREWVYFLPLGIGLGTVLRFIHFHARVPPAMSLLISVGTFVCGCAIRLVPFQQRRKLQLAIRCAGDDCRHFLWSSVAGAEASAGVVDHAHGGGCGLVALV